MNKEDLYGIGIASLVILSGVMAIVFVSYIKNVISKIEAVAHVGPLMDRVEKMVEKVEKMYTILEVFRQTNELEIGQLKERLRRLEDKVFPSGD